MFFNVRDYFIPEEYRELLSTAEQLATEFEKTAREIDEKGEFPYANIQRLTDAGLMDLAVPAQYGGKGTDAGFMAWLPHLVVQTIAKGCGSTAWSLLTQYHACGQLAALGSEEQKKRVFKDVVENGARISTLGSEIQAQEKKAKIREVKKGQSVYEGGLAPSPEEGGFRSTGFKGFTSTAAASDYIIYWSMAPNTDTAGTGLTLTIIPSDREGISYLPGWQDAIGIRASLSGPARFENIFVDKDEIVGEPGDFINVNPYTHDLTYAMLLLGFAERTYEFVLEVFSDRPYLQEEGSFMYRAGEISSAVQATWASCKLAQDLWDQEKWGEAHHATLRALHLAKATALDSLTHAFEIVGTRAIFKFNPLERIWRDARTASSHTREAWHMSMVAKGDLTGVRFSKEKYGEQSDNRKTMKELAPEVYS